MGKYLDAKKEIKSIEKQKENEIILIQQTIDDKQVEIDTQKALANWRKHRAKLKLDDEELALIHKALLIIDIIGFIVCIIALVFFDDVKFSGVMSYVFIKKFYKANAYRKAFWSVLSLAFVIDFVNNAINAILDVTNMLYSAYRHVQRILFNIANIITVGIIISKFQASMWNSQFDTLSKKIDLVFHSTKNSKIVMGLLLCIAVINLVLLLYHLGSFIYAIIMDKKAMDNSKSSKDKIIELEKEVKEKENEIDQTAKKFDEDIDIATQFAESIRLQGEVFFVDAMKSEPYDKELMDKAVEYDNPNACYEYVARILNEAEEGSLSDIERQDLLEKYLPYITIASDGGVASAKFLKIRTFTGRKNPHFTLDQLNQFINELLEAKKSDDFNYPTACANLIDDLDETVKKLEEKQRRIEEEKRHREEERRRAAAAAKAREEAQKVSIDFDASPRSSSLVYEVEMDGRPLLKIRGGEKKTTKVAPGYHSFTCKVYKYGSYLQELPAINDNYEPGSAKVFEFYDD